MAPEVASLDLDVPTPEITNRTDGSHVNGAHINGEHINEAHANGNPISNGNYSIPDLTYYDTSKKQVRVLTIGAGISGIQMAYYLQKYSENVEHVIYEKNEDIGGTWIENRYPGCACDIPSHAYTYNFALNVGFSFHIRIRNNSTRAISSSMPLEEPLRPEWPRFFSYAPDIWKYLDRVCNTFDLRKYMTFNSEVIGCWWMEDEGKWKVKIRQTKSGQSREFEETCDLLLHGTGILNNFKWPDIKGFEKFKGRMVHTARWPKDYQKEQWKSDRVAVIGSGASSIQTVPAMQLYAKHIDVFVRTGVWFVQLAGNTQQQVEYTTEQREEFRHNKESLVNHAKSIENQLNAMWSMFFKGGKDQMDSQDTYRKRMAEFIKDERLLKGFAPKFGVGCRRVTPGDPYMKAIQEDNVDVHFTPVVEITEDGVIGEDGTERKVDTIVCATGFDVSYRPRFPIVGKNGIDLKDKWKLTPEGYLGLGIPDFPNFITFIGPTWPIENGSVMGPLGTVAEYVLQLIHKMQGEFIKSFVPRQRVTDIFNTHCQELINLTIWTDDCRAWYKNNETGRVNAIWPGSSLHYQEVIKHPRWEDFDIEYEDPKHMWKFLGRGFAKANKVPGEDISPYLSVDAIDPKWWEAVRSDEGEEKGEGRKGGCSVM
ncbi:MAG: hypothetical protein M1834_009255 [Cirrosporium novae-zelandiae]|nr:MAG: hypothetical protein M1834_009255 [Cirrosporium novae-zelandiae]